MLVLEIYYSFSSYLNFVLHERILLNLRAYEITGECNNINRDFVAGRTVGARLRSELWLTMNYQGYLRVPFWSLRYFFCLLKICLLSQRIQPVYLLMAQNFRGRTKPFNYSYIAYPNAGGRGVAYFRQIRTRARTWEIGRIFFGRFSLISKTKSHSLCRDLTLYSADLFLSFSLLYRINSLSSGMW